MRGNFWTKVGVQENGQNSLKTLGGIYGMVG